MKEDDAINGIANGVFSFLNDRPVSVVDPAIEAIAKAMAQAVTDWLNNHEEEILDNFVLQNYVECKYETQIPD